MLATSNDFPFGIMDVAELLHLHIRRPYAKGYYADCPICGDNRGKMSLSTELNTWRCNYCGESGGMLSLYGRINHISNSAAYREISTLLQNSEFESSRQVIFPYKKEPELPKQSGLADVHVIHQTFSALLEMLKLSPNHREHLKNVRGLTDKQIDELGYKSTPSFFLCRKLTERLIEKGCMVQGVPGFYMKDGRWTIKFCTKMSGILIPVRGIDGLIYGMQIRLDVPIKDENDDPEKSGTKYIWLSSSNKPMGVSSGTPIHFIGDPYDRIIAGMFEKLKRRYSFKKQEFIVVPPRSLKELIQEGDKLHHCVGRYAKYVVQEKCVILFIRKANTPEEPYCTVELKNDEIVQARIFDNDPPPEKVQKFIEKWKQKVLNHPSKVA